MTVPDWVDLALSEQLPLLRSRGEGQDLEYKECFPQQTTQLGKEIAAFATANGGTILIGVSDCGDLVGIENAETMEVRDQLAQRVQGICHGTVKPAITPVIGWAIESSLHVMVVQVPKGTQPVYYSGNVPYLRHLTASRPAEPHEVIELVRSWLAVQEQADPENEVISEIMSLVNRALIFADEAGNRDCDTWLSQWRGLYCDTAAELRRIAAGPIAIKLGWAEELKSLAAKLHATGSLRLHSGSWEQLETLKDEALLALRDLKRDRLDPVPLSDRSLAEVKEVITTTARQLAGLCERMVPMVEEEGRIEEVQEEASGYGLQLLVVGYHTIDVLHDGLAARVQKIGHELHLVETMPLYCDGGASMQAIVDRIQAANDDLQALVAELGV